jgi:hypothetical protein
LGLAPKYNQSANFAQAKPNKSKPHQTNPN